MQRVVYEKAQVEGFKTSRTESIAVSFGGQRLFAGTTDGTIVLYECSPASAGYQSKSTHQRHPFPIMN